MAKFPMIIVNTSLPLLIQLKPNPNSISMDRNKVFSKTQTLGGWVFEHWGEQPRVLRVKGRTYPKLGSGADFAHSELGVEAAMFALQQLYTLDKRNMVSIASLFSSLSSLGKNAPKSLSQTFIYYRTDAYQGFFTNFKWEQSAENHPRHYEYEFEFLVTQSAQSYLTETILNSPAGPAIGALAGIATSGSQVLPLLKNFNIKGFSGLNL